MSRVVAFLSFDSSCAYVMAGTWLGFGIERLMEGRYFAGLVTLALGFGMATAARYLYADELRRAAARSASGASAEPGGEGAETHER